ncbi:MAG: hypothetical protein ABI761_06540 [Saprospiraceae bacterium]
MKNIFTLLLFAGSFLAPMMVISQITVKIDPNLKKPTHDILNAEQEVKVKETTQRIFLAYQQHASLYDKKSNLVTSETVRQFRDLFVPDATLPPDFMEQIREEIPVQEYGDKVITNLPTVGVQMIFDEASLKEIKYDPDGFFISIVEIQKTRYNYLDSKGEIRNSTSGKPMKQTIYISIPEKSPDRGYISRIAHVFEGTADLPSEQDTRIWAFSGGIGQGTLNVSESALWSDVHEASLLKSKTTLFSVGGELITTKIINPSRSPHKGLIFSLGIRYAIDKIETNFENFRTDTFPAVATEAANNTHKQTYIRYVGPIDGEEVITPNIFEIPVGIGLRLLNKKKTKLYLHARVIPRIVLNGDGDLIGPARYDGLLTYGSNNTKSQFRFLRNKAIKTGLLQSDLGFNAYQVGNIPLDLVAKPILKSTIAYQLSPTLYLDFSEYDETWGMLIGVDVTYHSKYIITSTPVETDLFRFPNDALYQSVVQQYSDKISSIGYGLRLGLFRKIIN